jgi:hypothetical protein
MEWLINNRKWKPKMKVLADVVSAEGGLLSDSYTAVFSLLPHMASELCGVSFIMATISLMSVPPSL